MIVANRLPVVRADDGSWEVSPGGLVSALAPIVQAGRGSWIGWAGTIGTPPKAFDHGGMRLTPLGLSAREIEGYYEGFSNRTLWPLYHDAVRPPEFDGAMVGATSQVNQRFAEPTAEVAAQGATVWVHDYQLQLVPAMLRELRPDLRIGFFLHIPFPPQELFMQLPWRSEILRGLLGADLVGFQRRSAAAELPAAGPPLLGCAGARRERRGRRPHGAGRARSRSRSTSAEIEALAAPPTCRRGPARSAAELGDPKTSCSASTGSTTPRASTIGCRPSASCSTDGRLDGARDGARADRDAEPRARRRTTSSCASEVERDGRAASTASSAASAHPAIHYLHQSCRRSELVALYRAADVMLVTPLRDGMNLVAKEYVAARDDGGGALVLSRVRRRGRRAAAGVARATPTTSTGCKEALMRAVRRDPRRGARRMRAMRRQVRDARRRPLGPVVPRTRSREPAA